MRLSPNVVKTLGLGLPFSGSRIAMVMENQEKRIHDKFNAKDSNVTIESADGVLFLLHTQNLKITTGAFPGSEFPTEGEHTKLTENAEVLEVVFAYTYPQRHPSLESMEFILLEKIAEAVEKYEVFPAINLCAVRMRESLPQHADDVLMYAVKHDHPRIINEAALALSRSPSMSKFLFKFPPMTLLAWVQYSESWNKVFQCAIDNIASMTASNDRSDIDVCWINSPTVNCHVSLKCLLMLLQTVRKLEKITSLADLQPSVSRFCGRTPPRPGFKYHCSTECIFLSDIAEKIQDSIAKITTFDQYLNEANSKAQGLEQF